MAGRPLQQSVKANPTEAQATSRTAAKANDFSSRSMERDMEAKAMQVYRSHKSGGISIDERDNKLMGILKDHPECSRAVLRTLAETGDLSVDTFFGKLKEEACSDNSEMFNPSGGGGAVCKNGIYFQDQNLLSNALKNGSLSPEDHARLSGENIRNAPEDKRDAVAVYASETNGLGITFNSDGTSSIPQTIQTAQQPNIPVILSIPQMPNVQADRTALVSLSDLPPASCINLQESSRLVSVESLFAASPQTDSFTSLIATRDAMRRFHKESRKKEYDERSGLLHLGSSSSEQTFVASSRDPGEFDPNKPGYSVVEIPAATALGNDRNTYNTNPNHIPLGVDRLLREQYMHNEPAAVPAVRTERNVTGRNAHITSITAFARKSSAKHDYSRNDDSDSLSPAKFGPGIRVMLASDRGQELIERLIEKLRSHSKDSDNGMDLATESDESEDEGESVSSQKTNGRGKESGEREPKSKKKEESRKSKDAKDHKKAEKKPKKKQKHEHTGKQLKKKRSKHLGTAQAHEEKTQRHKSIAKKPKEKILFEKVKSRKPVDETSRKHGTAALQSSGSILPVNLKTRNKSSVAGQEKDRKKEKKKKAEKKLVEALLLKKPKARKTKLEPKKRPMPASIF